MSKYSTLYVITLVLLLILQLLSCGKEFRMDYVPTPEQVKSTLPEFFIDESQIEGLYGNMDIDSMIFRYTYKVSTQASAEAILSTIAENAQKKGWKLSKKQPTRLIFNRFGPRGKFFSSEEVRVEIVQKKLRVYVAWVQADSRKPVLRFEDTGESKFANRVIWPKLKAYVAQE